MKVRELIELLATQDPEAEVSADGCSQCANPIVGLYDAGEYGVGIEVKV